MARISRAKVSAYGTAGCFAVVLIPIILLLSLCTSNDSSEHSADGAAPRFGGLELAGDAATAKSTGFSKCTIESSSAICNKGPFLFLGFPVKSASLTLSDFSKNEFSPETAAYSGLTVNFASSADRTRFVRLLQGRGWVESTHRGITRLNARQQTVEVSWGYADDSALVALDPVDAETSNKRVSDFKSQQDRSQAESSFIENMSS